MSDFWARALGVASPQPTAPAAPASSRPWWRGDAPTPPTPQAAPQQGTVPRDELAGHDLSKATSLLQTEACPECGSGNYAVTRKLKTRNGPVETSQCFDCGYPAMQEFSGMSGMSADKPVGHAKQIDSGGGIVHNYQPQNTIAGALRTAGDMRGAMVRRSE